MAVNEDVVTVGALIVMGLIYFAALRSSLNPIEIFTPTKSRDAGISYRNSLDESLSKAANPHKTVIITSVNDAWSREGNLLDLFLQSFMRGQGTKKLLKHLLIVAVDKKAFERCEKMHPYTHCYLMNTTMDYSHEEIFMSSDYLKMMWRRLKFFGQILELGYNYVFTDADILWFRDPFKHFYPEADMQFACDKYKGNPDDLRNSVNLGFMYIMSNNKTIEFFRDWHAMRKLYPGKNEQDVFNMIKAKELPQRKLWAKFLDTNIYSGYCQMSKKMDSVCTMHANCCKTLKAKLHGLKITLSDWAKYTSRGGHGGWSAPKACHNSWH